MFADNTKQANDKTAANPPDAAIKDLFESPDFYKATATEPPTIEVEVVDPNTQADTPKNGKEEKDEGIFTVKDRRFWADEKPDDKSSETLDGETNGETQQRGALPTFVEELVKKLAEKEELLQKYIANYKREVAEMEAFKERSRRDQERKVRQEKANFVVQLLDFVDNMGRSLGGNITEANYKDFFVGIQMSYSQLLSVLASEGITKIDVLNQPFDPVKAEALDIVPVSDEAQDDIVLQELQPGYMFKDTVLRAAKVKVGKLLSSSS